MSAAYYNENDPYAAAWLRNLIAAGLIAAGDVDERSIVDVAPADLAGYRQCHFFAGIAGWSHALRLAGWPDDRPVWTGSCPCQPLSGAGKRQGDADERHLWPAFHRLIAECRPAIVLGEQVASADGREWLAAVRLDLEELGYASGAADLCAAGVGAPHIRQRLFWVADAVRPGRAEWWAVAGDRSAAERGGAGRVADAADERRALGNERSGAPGRESGSWAEPLRQGDDGRVGVADGAGWITRQPAGAALGHGDTAVATGGLGDAIGDGRREGGNDHAADVGHFADATCGVGGRSSAEPGRGAGFWADAEWIGCADGKARPTGPGIFPLAHGVPARVGKLRAAGNAIVPQVAAEFVGAYLEAQAHVAALFDVPAATAEAAA